MVYNRTVQTYEDRRRALPGALVAGPLGFGPQAYWQPSEPIVRCRVRADAAPLGPGRSASSSSSSSALGLTFAIWLVERGRAGRRARRRRHEELPADRRPRRRRAPARRGAAGARGDPLPASAAASAAPTATSRWRTGRRSRTSSSPRAPTAYRPGGNTVLGGFGLPGHLRHGDRCARTTSATCASSGTTRRPTRRASSPSATASPAS